VTQEHDGGGETNLLGVSSSHDIIYTIHATNVILVLSYRDERPCGSFLPTFDSDFGLTSLSFRGDFLSAFKANQVDIDIGRNWQVLFSFGVLFIRYLHG
jgi:hypothetical protein